MSPEKTYGSVGGAGWGGEKTGKKKKHVPSLIQNQSPLIDLQSTIDKSIVFFNGVSLGKHTPFTGRLHAQE